MEKQGFNLGDGASPADAKQTNPQEARKFKSIQRFIEVLVHTRQCRDANCRLLSCQKMKLVAMHTKNCKRKANGGCPICKQLIAVYCYHAKHCQETKKCLISCCSSIKHKIKQKQLQQAQFLTRRMAVMNTRPTGPVAAMQAGQQTSNVAMTSGVAMKPGVSTSNLPTPHQPGIGLKPGTQTPPAHVLQMVKQVQEEAARQQAHHVSYGKVTPGGGVGVGVGVGGQTGGVMPPPQMQWPLPVQMPNPSGTHFIPMDSKQVSVECGDATKSQLGATADTATIDAATSGSIDGNECTNAATTRCDWTGWTSRSASKQYAGTCSSTVSADSQESTHARSTESNTPNTQEQPTVDGCVYEATSTCPSATTWSALRGSWRPIHRS